MLEYMLSEMSVDEWVIFADKLQISVDGNQIYDDVNRVHIASLLMNAFVCCCECLCWKPWSTMTIIMMIWMGAVASAFASATTGSVAMVAIRMARRLAMGLVTRGEFFQHPICLSEVWNENLSCGVCCSGDGTGASISHFLCTRALKDHIGWHAITSLSYFVIAPFLCICLPLWTKKAMLNTGPEFFCSFN